MRMFEVCFANVCVIHGNWSLIDMLHCEWMPLSAEWMNECLEVLFSRACLKSHLEGKSRSISDWLCNSGLQIGMTLQQWLSNKNDFATMTLQKEWLCNYDFTIGMTLQQWLHNRSDFATITLL